MLLIPMFTFFVANVVKSFDTVDRGILDRVLSSLGLPGWFRHAYFEYHAHVRLRFKLASGLGQSWTLDGGIPQGSPLSMMFIVALYLPWCRNLSAQVGVQPQLYADNLKCLSHNHDLLLHSARFTTKYVRLVGQEPASSKCVLLSTSREVRKDMKDWVLSQEEDQWSVKFDVRDLGGHLDTTFRGWSSPLAARFRLVISRLALIFVLPLDFHGRVRVVRSMYLPAALHGIEASLLASESLRRLRSAVRWVVWSRRHPLANVGAVLSLLDGPTGCDPAFGVVWYRFRLLRRYLALWPAEVGRVYRLLEMVADGCPGHGPIHLLSSSAAEIGFRWNPDALAWERPGLPMVSHIAGPIQHFRSAILDAWRNKVAGDLCGRKGFRGGPLLDIHGSLQLLSSSHVRERDKGLLRSILVGGVWNGFLLGRVCNQVVPCRFCSAPEHDGHLFWECTFPPLVEIRESPEIHDLMRMDKAHWPRCLLWHGWLPMLSGCNGGSPWAGTASESAHYLVEASLGGYSSGLVLVGILRMGMILLQVLALYRIPPMFGLMVALSLIRLLVFPPPVLDSLLIILPLFGMFVPGGWLIIFTLLVTFRLVEASALFLGLISLFRGLRCGELFWLYNLLVLFTWVLTIWELFVMLVVCWMGVLALFLLSFLRMVIFFCSLTG